MGNDSFGQCLAAIGGQLPSFVGVQVFTTVNEAITSTYTSTNFVTKTTTITAPTPTIFLHGISLTLNYTDSSINGYHRLYTNLHYSDHHNVHYQNIVCPYAAEQCDNYKINASVDCDVLLEWRETWSLARRTNWFD